MNIQSRQHQPAAPTLASFQVAGMTCGHCEAAVAAEIGALAGVGAVRADKATGTVTVASEGPLERAAVAAAVEEAGCTLA